MRFRGLPALVLVLVAGLGIAGCDAISSAIPTTAPGDVTTSTPADVTTTEAPATTEAPPVTEAPDEEDAEGSLVPYLGLILLAVLLLGVLIGRSRRRRHTPPPVPVAEKLGFKDYVRDGYGEARWLLDALSDELAIWRGNALFEDKTGAGDSAGTAYASTWAQLDTRMDRATDQLYRAEASAPDQNTSQMVRATTDALHQARSAVDARAEARYNSRQADAGYTLAEAGERERLASTTLTEARQQLNDALLALSAVV